MPAVDIPAILKTAQTIAVVGLSSKPDRPSYEVASYLQSKGYQIIPVNPNETEVLGERAYAHLTDIPIPVDVVDIFRASQFVVPHVQQAIAIGAKVVWMQEGVINEEAARLAHDAGLTVVTDQCMMKKHKELEL